MSQSVSLEILEPRGVLKNPKREGLFAPRLGDLNGKTIALMGINILWSLRRYGKLKPQNL